MRLSWRRRETNLSDRPRHSPILHCYVAMPNPGGYFLDFKRRSNAATLDRRKAAHYFLAFRDTERVYWQRGNCNIDALQEFCAWLSIIGLCKDCRSGADRSKEHLRGRGLRLWWGGRAGGHARGGVIRSLVDKVWSRP